MTSLAPDPRPLPPGLLASEPGLEKYRVRPGSVTAVHVEPGDRVDVVDLQGRQTAEVTVLPDDGGSPDLPADAPASVLRTLSGPGAARVLEAIRQQRTPAREARAALLFGAWSPAGSRETFRATAPALVVVAVPAARMRVDDIGAAPPSDIGIELRRAVPRPRTAELPPPLAEPVLDVRVPAATAMSYEVEEGQYVQVLDVEGRQCSDFLAFDARALHDGAEHGLDSTTTRSLTGTAWPKPGLFGRFYDQHANPLVEVVRDTVGRHDTFGLACNAKYYADLGYPGHVNCTDNFNAELAGYGVAPRAGWPALNFFYNTAFDDQHQIVVDEPWSKPGDYVLLRATADLVCASSACPDDVDPSNAWVPTDVHVRVYDSKRKFSVAVAHRPTPESEAELTKETGFHSRTSALTRHFTEYHGYWLPESYDGYGTRQEYWACRERAAVMDLSALRKFEVLGPDAEELLQATVTRDVRRLAEGQVTYSAICDENGSMLDDGTLFRLGHNNFRLVAGDVRDGEWLREQARLRELDRVWVKESTDQLHNLAVQGPLSRDLLGELVRTPPSQPAVTELGLFRFTIGRLHTADGTPLLVSRTGYTGELGYELWVHPDDAETVWDAVWDAGRPRGLAPLGLAALDVLRIEAGLAAAGHEFCDDTDPFEAGIGFTVPLRSKVDDFVGRDALVQRREQPRRRLVGLRIEGNEPAQHGDGVYVGRRRVGIVTSAALSPVLRSNIALCRVATRYAEPEGRVEIGRGRRRVPATITQVPFYDPEKTRLRS